MSDYNRDNTKFLNSLVRLVPPDRRTPQILPVLGPGLLENVISQPLETFVRDWHEQYPLPIYEPVYYGEIPRFAQHRAAMEGADEVIQEFCDIIPTDLSQIHDEAAREPYTLLAHLRCSLYMTTTVDSLLEKALEDLEGKSPQVVYEKRGKHSGASSHEQHDYDTEEQQHQEELLEIKRRSLRVLEKQQAQYSSLNVPPHIALEIEDLRVEIEKLEKGNLREICEKPLTSSREPTAPQELPIVYKILGSISNPDSVKLLENDYFEYLMTLGLTEGTIEHQITTQLQDDSLLFLGFRVEDWTFRAVFQSLVKRARRQEWRRHPDFFVFPRPDVEKRESMSKYLTWYFRPLLSDIRIYWGSLPEFFNELKQRLPTLSQLSK